MKMYKQELDEYILNITNLSGILREVPINDIIKDGVYLGHEPQRYFLRDSYGNIFEKIDKIKHEIPYSILVRTIFKTSNRLRKKSSSYLKW